jgi:integrase
LFGLRWQCFQGETIKIDASVYRGKLVRPKTRSSEALVALPASLAGELMQWYEATGHPAPEALIFSSRVNTPINSQNYLKRDTLRPAAAKVEIEGLTFQSLRRTFATHFHGMGTVKDQQSQMRHSTAQMTLDVYTQSVSESLKAAVEAFDHKLRTSKPEGKSRRDGAAPEVSETDSEPQSVTGDNEPEKGFEPK